MDKKFLALGAAGFLILLVGTAFAANSNNTRPMEIGAMNQMHAQMVKSTDDAGLRQSLAKMHKGCTSQIGEENESQGMTGTQASGTGHMRMH